MGVSRGSKKYGRQIWDTKKSQEGENVEVNMNLVSCDIRGCDNSMKRRRLCQLLEKCMVDTCFIQESKLQSMNDQVVRGVWETKTLNGRAKQQKVNQEE